MNYTDYLRFLFNRKGLFSLVFVFTFCLSFVVLHYGFKSYTSTTGFIVNNRSELGISIPDKFVLNVLTDENDILTNRIFRICYSDSMYSYLIQEFDLYQIMEINADDPYAYSRVVRALSSMIKITKVSSNYLNLSVTSGDIKLSADMANSIARKINEINARILRNEIDIKIDFFKKLSLTLTDKFASLNGDLTRHFDELRLHNNNHTLSPVQVDFVYKSILGVTQTMQREIDRYLDSKMMSDFVLQRFIDESIESIIIMNRAIPDVGSDLPKNIFLSLASGLFLSFSIGSIYFFLIHKNSMNV